MLTPEAAWAAIETRLEPADRAPRREVARAGAVGRVLARALEARVAMPPADVSAMDGYAIAGEAKAGATLAVTATVAAGSPLSGRVAPGTAVKIMTGAVVPAGADRVLPVEQTDGGGERVLLRAAPAEGAHIRRGGEVVTPGAPLLAAGTFLTPGAVSLLASHGYRTVPVVATPSVAVMATGDEVVPPETEPLPGQLRDSNSAFLLAAGRSLGQEFEPLGIAPDDPDELRRRIDQGLRSDVLLLCGGVSMGEFDLIPDVLGELGCELLFDKVAIQPGKPLVVARHAGGWVFGLPGNPASVMVTFWLFVKPLLERLRGLGGGFWHGALAAELGAPAPPGKGRDRFLPAAVAFRDGRIVATPRPPRGSHDVVAYGHGTALLRVRPDAEKAPAGADCEVLPLVEWPGG